jgi:maltose/moltooligosaccharide transporter
MIGLGIAWASMMGVPYIMVVSMVPKERHGVYMGIVNMMIVVPMLIETVSFGFIYDHFLHTPTHALEFSGMLFAVAAVAMTWIRPPKKQSPVIPLTSGRSWATTGCWSGRTARGPRCWPSSGPAR